MSELEPISPSVEVARSRNPKPRGPALNVVLFLLTMVTTWWAGASGRSLSEMIDNGLVYMASIMGILLSHEMGHYFFARRNRVPASLPYFIPFPFNLFGTFGAVIVMRGRIRTRSALMEVGAAGPLAGMIVAVPIILIGLSLSPVAPIQTPGILEGSSLLYLLFKWIAVGSIPEGYDVFLHPMAWAGWVGMLVTMLNLLPIGQLDGGHIAYALFGRAHQRISIFFFWSLFVLGLAVSGYEGYGAWQAGLRGEPLWARVQTGVPWLVIGFVMFVLFRRKNGAGFRHPPTDDDTLSPIHRAVGICCIIVFGLTFMPVPLRILL